MLYFHYFISITFSFFVGYYFGFNNGIVKKCDWCIDNIKYNIVNTNYIEER